MKPLFYIFAFICGCFLGELIFDIFSYSNEKDKLKYEKIELATQTFMKLNSDKNITYDEAKNYITFMEGR